MRSTQGEPFLCYSANALCFLPGDDNISDTAATLPGCAAFESPVTIIVLRAGYFNEPALQDLTTVGQDLGNTIIRPHAAPDQDHGQRKASPQAQGLQPCPPRLPWFPVLLGAARAPPLSCLAALGYPGRAPPLRRHPARPHEFGRHVRAAEPGTSAATGSEAAALRGGGSDALGGRRGQAQAIGARAAGLGGACVRWRRRAPGLRALERRLQVALPSRGPGRSP